MMTLSILFFPSDKDNFRIYFLFKRKDYNGSHFQTGIIFIFVSFISIESSWSYVSINRFSIFNCLDADNIPSISLFLFFHLMSMLPDKYLKDYQLLL